MTAADVIAVPARQRFAARGDGRLDPDMAAAFVRDGFLILEGFAAPQDCDLLQQRMAVLMQAFDPAGIRTVFSTVDQSHGDDRYFLDSGDKIRFFFEPGAFDAEGNLTRETPQTINKVGHALHDLDPVFNAFSRSPRFAALAADLGLQAPLLLQSMYIFKQPQIGAEVGWHQDASFLYTRPSSAIGFWLALDDATAENGCMVALAGAHHGPLRQRFIREGHGARMVDETPAPWPSTRPVLLDVPRGSLIVLHGRLPHASGANHSALPRHAYALHLIDGTASYAADNWLQRPDFPPRGFA